MQRENDMHALENHAHPQNRFQTQHRVLRKTNITLHPNDASTHDNLTWSTLECWILVLSSLVGSVGINPDGWHWGGGIYQPSIGTSPLNWFEFPPIPITFDSYLDGTDDNDIDCAPILTFEAESGLAFPGWWSGTPDVDNDAPDDKKTALDNVSDPTADVLDTP